MIIRSSIFLHRHMQQIFKFPPITNILSRQCSNDSKKKWLMPPLMDWVPFTPMPKFQHAIRNFIYINFLIKPYFDKEFSKDKFLEGSKLAVEFVSNCLAQGDIDTLEESEVLSDECLQELKLNISLFNLEQRHRLAVEKKVRTYLLYIKTYLCKKTELKPEIGSPDFYCIFNTEFCFYLPKYIFN